MKNASTAPGFRLWTPTGDVFPAPGASAVGFGKAMTDVDTKWYNKDAWRMESFVKSGKQSGFWVDPAANKNGKGAEVSATFAYDDLARNLKWRGLTKNNAKANTGAPELEHVSDIAHTMPLLDGEQRVKLQFSTTLDKTTHLPKIDENLTTKIFWKAMLPAFTAEAIVTQTAKGTKGVNAWVQGEVSDDIAYGGFVEYSMEKGLGQWEGGLLHTLQLGAGVLGFRGIVRNGEKLELGVFPPALQLLGKKTQLYLKANHDLAKSSTDLALASEVKVCPCMDFKARFAYTGLKDLGTSFAAIFNAQGGWRVAASLANPGSDKMQFGLRMAQGSTPAPL